MFITVCFKLIINQIPNYLLPYFSKVFKKCYSSLPFKKLFMKKIVFLLGAFVCLNACKQSDKTTTKNFIIEGTITNSTIGDTLVLTKAAIGEKADTTYIQQGGKFSFKGNYTDPIPAYIFFPSSVAQTQQAITVFLEEQAITINTTKTNLIDASVKGGKNNTELQLVLAINKLYDPAMKLIGDSLNALYSKGDTQILSKLERQYLQLENNKKQNVLQFVKEHNTSYVSAYYAYQLTNFGSDMAMVEPVFNSLDKTMQESFYGLKLKKVVDALQATSIGKAAPDFTLNDVNDKPIQLSSLQGKYILLDFWASWCRPCRMENPNVVKAFETFKNKNFTVLGVSLDEDKAAWLNAIAKDNLMWQHLSDLKGWRSTAATLYNVQSIPANFLIDPSGKIVAKDLRGEALESKLKELLH